MAEKVVKVYAEDHKWLVNKSAELGTSIPAVIHELIRFYENYQKFEKLIKALDALQNIIDKLDELKPILGKLKEEKKEEPKENKIKKEESKNEEYIKDIRKEIEEIKENIMRLSIESRYFMDTLNRYHSASEYEKTKLFWELYDMYKNKFGIVNDTRFWFALELINRGGKQI